MLSNSFISQLKRNRSTIINREIQMKQYLISDWHEPIKHFLKLILEKKKTQHSEMDSIYADVITNV